MACLDWRIVQSGSVLGECFEITEHLSKRARILNRPIANPVDWSVPPILVIRRERACPHLVHFVPASTYLAGRNSTLVLDYLHHCWRRSTSIAVLMPPNLVWTRTLRLDPTTREERENAGSILLAGSSDARALVPVERAAVR